MDRERLEQRYFKLGNELPNRYPQLDFKNHCYWRIALDKALGDKWDRIIGKPAYKYLSDDQLKQVVGLMDSYRTDRSLLQEHNKESLRYRGKK